MLDRRQWLSTLALGATGFGLHAAENEPSQVPRLSTAPLGDAVARGWMHQRLPKVERANTFSIVADGERRVLQVRSAASSSSWVAPVDVDLERTPWLHWQWKVSRSLPGSDLRTKAGDDYAARLYVTFDLPLDRLSLKDRLGIQAARLLSGAEIPAAALCYVWGNAQPVGSTAWNPYTDRVRMIVVDSQDAQAGRWRTHARNVRDDWAEAFGGAMPHANGVAVGADTDNTGDQVDSWFGDVRFAAGP